MPHQEQNPLAAVLTFLERLDASRITYRLNKVRDALMVELAIPGERWEVEFFATGEVEIERFRSSGQIETDETVLNQLFVSSDDPAALNQ